MMHQPIILAGWGAPTCSFIPYPSGMWGGYRAGDPCQPRTGTLWAGGASGANQRGFVCLQMETGQRLCSANEFIQGADRGQTDC